MMTLPLFGWLVLVPVVLLMVFRSPMEAGLAAALVGALASSSTVWSKTLRALVPLSAIPSALAWGATTAFVAWLVPKPWLVVGFPLAMVAATLPLRLVGAPRFVANPLLRTQERWLVVVHTARYGGELVTTSLLATASASIALAIGGHVIAAIAGAIFVGALLLLGWASLTRAIHRSEAGQRLAVAAVVVDGKPPASGERSGLWPAESPEYRDVAGTLTRYRPHVERAAREGASVIVLPEVSVYLEDAAAASRWRAGIEAWARDLDVAIVAPFFDASTPKNTLVVVDRSGVVGTYDKQHPVRGVEPPCPTRMPVGPCVLASGATLSTAICADLDYSDIASSARRAGKVLAAPSNDWDSFALLHHRAAVWAAVIGGVPLVRAAGQGISSIYDGAGRVMKQQSSAAGPVVLVGEVRA